MRRAWKRLNADPDKPLLALSHQELFLPGSSFKIVTASAALENGFGPDSVWPNPHRLTLPLTNEELQNFGDDHCNGGSAQITMIEAFEESCNVTFAEIGLELGAERIVGAGARVRPVRHAPAGAHDVRRAAHQLRAPVPERTVPGARVLRAERPAPGVLRDRPGQRPGEPVADGADRVRRGERRRDAAAEARDGGPRRAGTGGAGVRCRRRRAGDQRGAPPRRSPR